MRRNPHLARRFFSVQAVPFRRQQKPEQYCQEQQGGFVLRKAVVLALALSALTPGAFAQDYPNRVITLVAPFPPGGPSDTTARMIVGPMSQALGQQIIVENVTGAGGTIGTNKVAKAAPDGYTIMISGSGTHSAAEFLHPGLPYHATDFTQIGLINTSPMILVARSSVPPNNLKDFLAYLRTNEKKLTEA